MKLEQPINPNYAATVFRVKTLVKLPNSDNLQGIPAFGLQAIVDMQTQVGDLGVLFPTECQLSDAYVKNNSLYRHSELNADPAHKGYLEDNRRVRALRLRGNRSDALFMPLESLAFTGVKIEELQEGMSFDVLNDVEICKKYEVRRREPRHVTNKKKIEKRVDEKMFPEHFDSLQFLRVVESLDPNLDCVITQKLHGTSIRVGNVPVKRKLTWLEKLAQKVGVNVATTEYAMVYGSRKVIKDANNPNQQHYYEF